MTPRIGAQDAGVPQQDANPLQDPNAPPSGRSVAGPGQVLFQLNGAPAGVDTDPERSLLEVLREEFNLTGAKYGCGEGRCRACTVLVDGRAVTSCRFAISRAAGRDVRTIEGLSPEPDKAMHKVQQAFMEAGAMQCGYCIPGMILTTCDLLARNARPSREEIIDALDGNLCRCCGYVRILEAVEKAARAP